MLDSNLERNNRLAYNFYSPIAVLFDIISSLTNMVQINWQTSFVGMKWLA